MNNFQDRKDGIRHSKPQRFDVVRGVAQNVSNSLRYSQKAELLNECLLHFVEQLFEVDERGQLINVDPIDGRLLVRVPWRKHWNSDDKPSLLASERTVLRSILRLSQTSEKTPPLFVYDCNRWYVMLHDYRNVQQAKSWVEAVGINAATWNRLDTMRRTNLRAIEQAA